MSLKITSWNVHRGVSPRGTPNRDGVADEIRRMSPDFVGLQEVPSQIWVDKLTETLLASGLAYTHHFEETDPDGSGLALLSVRECVVSVVEYPPVCTSAALKKAVVMTHEDVHVITTHLSANCTMAAQWVQAAHLAKHVSTIEGHVFVMGDLNCHHVSPPMHKLRSVGLKDTRRSSRTRSRGYLNGCTFPSAMPFQRIDYILARSNYVCNTSRVGRVPASDHMHVTAHMSPA